jgi:hypothetical protein
MPKKDIIIVFLLWRNYGTYAIVNPLFLASLVVKVKNRYYFSYEDPFFR